MKKVLLTIGMLVCGIGSIVLGSEKQRLEIEEAVEKRFNEEEEDEEEDPD